MAFTCQVAVLAAALLLTACRAPTELADVADPAITPADQPTAVTTPPPTSTADPLGTENPWPSMRPSDFRATWSQDGGSAPWGEGLEIESAGARYEVFMDGIEYVFLYSPPEARLDALYGQIRDGRFDLHRRVEFPDGEMIYDAESERWRVSAGGVSHSLSVSGQDIWAPPDLAGAPLSAIAGFADLDRVPAAIVTGHVVIDDTAARLDLWQVQLVVDFGEVDLAVGDDRWTDRMQVATSAPADVAVRLQRSTGATDDPDVLFEGQLAFGPGTELVLEADRTGALHVRRIGG